MVLHGAGSIQISHRFSKDFRSSSLLILMSVSPQCPETPETHPSSFFSFSGLGDVFIHMDSSLYSLPCSTIELEVANPTYQWVRDRPDPKLLSVTEEGHLLFQNFQAADSGNYSCTISYTEHGLPVSQTFHYRVLGYHILGGLETLLIFHSKLCKDEWTKMFLWDLLERLKQVEVEQHCKIHPETTACFPSADNPSNEFVVQIQLAVSFFGPNWDEQCKPQGVEVDTDCYRRTAQQSLKKVQHAITKFFKEHIIFHISGPDTSRIDFITVFIGFLEMKNCSEGYGQTKQLQRCLECCTDAIIRKVPILLFIIVPLVVAANLLFIFASCYWYQQQYRLSSPKTSKMAGISKTMQKVTEFCRIPRQSPQARPFAATLNMTSETDMSQEGEEEYLNGEFSPPRTPSLAAVSDDTPAVLELEDKLSIFEIPSTNAGQKH
ncbi:hypothetical protein CIB84_009140 [Bambusicola thoracicus]|uniref:Ig-like domain-containing protein n=1 Tax=Bambusicola thoracicus TaxID=9083 RepID=A0A2P4SSM1_BAMTH|nr:hypothetical protein CIB84_009140 [Bambusicola thoracicus]